MVSYNGWLFGGCIKMAQVLHYCRISKTGTDGTDFSTNYKSKAEKVTDVLPSSYSHDIDYTTFKGLIDGENYTWEKYVKYIEEDDYYNLYIRIGKDEVMTTSRAPGTSVVFASAGDKITTPQEIGGGQSTFFDFSNTDDDVTAPTGYKRKQFDLQFIDKVWLKEGGVYFFNAAKGAYVQFQVVCPSGQYYYKNDGTPTLATEDTVVHNYVFPHYIQGDCPMGDELNTEAATLDPLPTNYYMRVTVTVPSTNTTCNGYAEIEMYRVRSIILE